MSMVCYVIRWNVNGMLRDLPLYFSRINYILYDVVIEGISYYRVRHSCSQSFTGLYGRGIVYLRYK
jgi:hypothetical protein